MKPQRLCSPGSRTSALPGAARRLPVLDDWTVRGPAARLPGPRRDSSGVCAVSSGPAAWAVGLGLRARLGGRVAVSRNPLLHRGPGLRRELRGCGVRVQDHVVAADQGHPQHQRRPQRLRPRGASRQVAVGRAQPAGAAAASRAGARRRGAGEGTGGAFRAWGPVGLRCGGRRRTALERARARRSTDAKSPLPFRRRRRSGGRRRTTSGRRRTRGRRARTWRSSSGGARAPRAGPRRRATFTTLLSSRRGARSRRPARASAARPRPRAPRPGGRRPSAPRGA